MPWASMHEVGIRAASINGAQPVRHALAWGEHAESICSGSSNHRPTQPELAIERAKVAQEVPSEVAANR